MHRILRILAVVGLSHSLALAGILAVGLGHPVALAQNEEDVTPPVISGVVDLIVAAVDGSGAVVSYALPAISDDTDPNPSLTCAPVSGALFPLGPTLVTCAGEDASGNRAEASFAIIVADQSPPILTPPASLAIQTDNLNGTYVDYEVPLANDAVDGPVGAGCDVSSGSLFPIGTTWVTCSAADYAGNAAAVSFSITIELIESPEPTDVPVPTEEASVEPTDPPASNTPESTETPEGPAKTATPKATKTPVPTSTATMTPSPTPTAAALELTGPIPNFTLVVDGGPLGLLTSIWGDLPAPVSQEYGHTAFSVTHSKWYWYGRLYGLDGFAHPGLDIAIPSGTPLYSPVSGTVMIAGGQPFYTFYGNGQPGVGELMIQTDAGDQVILGHMGLITVNVGDQVELGQFVGLSGGYNGDHLHLETRSLQEGKWYLLVDPRQSFLMPELEAAAAEQSGTPTP